MPCAKDGCNNDGCNNDGCESIPPVDTSSDRPRRFFGRRKRGGSSAPSTDLVKRTAARTLMSSQIPDEIENDPELKRAMEQLPSNYNFQIAKTVWRLKKDGAQKVALQLPEGLMLFACILADIFEQCAGVKDVLIMADVTYGACCVDDYSARALGCDFMVHYGHSCLVPIDVTAKSSGLKLLYVFVDIDIDVEHLVESVKLTFENRNTRIALLCTIQFAAAMHKAKQLIDDIYTRQAYVPQAKPLSRGEVLGCTSPSLACEDVDCLVFVADGRFHLESAMIANPHLPAERYDPYTRVLTIEHYDTHLMREIRKGQIDKASDAQSWGVVLGTLGRQGNPKILERIEKILKAKNKRYVVLLLSEMFPAKLKLLDDSVDAWVQIACPRLSVDWGTAFSKPLLSPYELFVAVGEAAWREEYPQDFYAKGSGPWTNFYEEPKSV